MKKRRRISIEQRVGACARRSRAGGGAHGNSRTSRTHIMHYIYLVMHVRYIDGAELHILAEYRFEKRVPAALLLLLPSSSPSRSLSFSLGYVMLMQQQQQQPPLSRHRTAAVRHTRAQLANLQASLLLHDGSSDRVYVFAERIERFASCARARSRASPRLISAICSAKNRHVIHIPTATYLGLDEIIRIKDRSHSHPSASQFEAVINHPEEGKIIQLQRGVRGGCGSQSPSAKSETGYDEPSRIRLYLYFAIAPFAAAAAAAAADDIFVTSRVITRCSRGAAVDPSSSPLLEKENVSKKRNAPDRTYKGEMESCARGNVTGLTLMHIDVPLRDMIYSSTNFCMQCLQFEEKKSTKQSKSLMREKRTYHFAGHIVVGSSRRFTYLNGRKKTDRVGRGAFCKMLLTLICGTQRGWRCNRRLVRDATSVRHSSTSHKKPEQGLTFTSVEAFFLVLLAAASLHVLTATYTKIHMVGKDQSGRSYKTMKSLSKENFIFMLLSCSKSESGGTHKCKHLILRKHRQVPINFWKAYLVLAEQSLRHGQLLYVLGKVPVAL
ncbi:unnamed protein product, partial [Trichogramma brassicae]